MDYKIHVYPERDSEDGCFCAIVLKWLPATSSLETGQWVNTGIVVRDPDIHVAFAKVYSQYQALIN